MAEPNRTEVTAAYRERYKLGDKFNYIDISGGGGSNLYASQKNLRADRVGYSILSCLSYRTNCPIGSFILPLPAGLTISSDFSWSEASEDGLSAAGAMLGEGAGRANTALKTAEKGISRWAAKAISDLPGMQGIFRSQGIAYNPNNQMYFQGVSFSQYPFQFKLAPRNASEASQMYLTIKALARLTAPGVKGEGFGGMLDTLLSAGESMLFKQSQTDEAKQKMKENKAMNQLIQEGQKLMKDTEGAMYNDQPAFFEYPPLWDISIHVPDQNIGQYVPTFQWRRLACTSLRFDYGSNQKWHKDGYPLSIDLTIELKETILKTAQRYDLVMPTIIR